MKIHTSRFGTIEIPDRTILTFPSGVLGFPSSTRYVVLDHDREVLFKWLQSVDDESLAFVVADPVLCKPDYQVDLTSDDINELRLSSEESPAVMVILTIPTDDPSRITANLRGPLIVNQRYRLAKQIIVREDQPTRYPLFTQPTQSVTV